MTAAKWLSIEEAANTVSVHPNTLYSAIRAGRLEARRRNRGRRAPYLISKRQLLRWYDNWYGDEETGVSDDR